MTKFRYKLWLVILLGLLIICIIIRKLDKLPEANQLPGHLLKSNSYKVLNITLKYILNNENVCNNKSEDILAIFIITSYFGNTETRNSLRQSFDSRNLESYKLRRVFLLGESPQDKYTTQQLINKEHEQHADIIQGNFTEAYRNLTYKHTMGLKWACTYCKNAKYIIKMDDDIVINMYNLNLILEPLNMFSRKDFIAGYVLRNLKPIRTKENKWYVTKEEYSLNSYPNFVSGWFYVTTIQTASKLVALLNKHAYFWIDDVFITGIIASKLKILLLNLNRHFTPNSEFLQCCLRDFQNNLNCDISIGPNGGDNNMYFKFNEGTKKCFLEKNCKNRSKSINETCVAEKLVNLGRGNAIVNKIRL